MSPDPLSEEFPSWSPYNFVMNNPIRLVDPDGRAPNDIIKFMNNGSIERIITNDNFDVVSNESGTKTAKIDHKDGRSQIGTIQDVRTSTGSAMQFMLISDNQVARDIFEFAASTTTNNKSNAEFGLDMFNFNDGFSMNLFQTGEISAKGAANVIPLGQVGRIDLGNSHFIKDSNWIENNHSHPGTSPLTPTGFRRGFINGAPNFTPEGDGDRSLFKGRNPSKTYVYGAYEKTYIEHDSESAKVVGNRKK